jgi:hypothetical protein
MKSVSCQGRIHPNAHQTGWELWSSSLLDKQAISVLYVVYLIKFAAIPMRYLTSREVAMQKGARKIPA